MLDKTVLVTGTHLQVKPWFPPSITPEHFKYLPGEILRITHHTCTVCEGQEWLLPWSVTVAYRIARITAISDHRKRKLDTGHQLWHRLLIYLGLPAAPLPPGSLGTRHVVHKLIRSHSAKKHSHFIFPSL